MWAGVVPLLVPVHCKRGKAAPGALDFTCYDYADFANLDTARLSSLEAHVADSLYRCCSECDSPEIKRVLLDKQLRGVFPNDKARYLVFAMLKWGGRSELFERLVVNVGYAGRLLLYKLCSSPSIKTLTWKPKVPICIESPHQTFCSAAEECPDGLREINQYLEKVVITEGEKSLPEVAENGSGLDLAMHAIRAQNGPEVEILSDAFSQLANVWSGDPVKRGRLLPGVIDFIRIVLLPEVFRNTQQAKLRRSVVKYVILNSERECFELFRAFTNRQALSMIIQEYIGPEPKKDASLEFVHSYLDYIAAHDENRPDRVAYNFFCDLLPAPADFHAPATVWNSDPVRFNLISTRWLREMFEDLRDGPAHEPRRAEFMRKYMRQLRYDVFVCMLRCYDKKECKKMSVFMLAHLSTKGREEYSQCYYRDTGTDRRHKKVLDVLDSIFKR
ncbi:hypothetical protein PAPHI01_0684 [Pancytospora philotis]|nr:hypothetical protein PAPHI01_0684 [Pancytospora philotis]